MAIDVYGATWCGDCKQAKNTLEELGAEYTWHNIETEDGAADRAVAISGQQHIPVVLYPCPLNPSPTPRDFSTPRMPSSP